MITQLENRLGCDFLSLNNDMWHIKGNNWVIIKYCLKHKCSLFLPEDSDVKDSCGLKAKDAQSCCNLLSQAAAENQYTLCLVWVCLMSLMHAFTPTVWIALLCQYNANGEK